MSWDAEVVELVALTISEDQGALEDDACRAITTVAEVLESRISKLVPDDFGRVSKGLVLAILRGEIS
jgi:hypothetical protein